MVVLAGGVGGSRFLLGARRWFDDHGHDPATGLTAIVNTADDLWVAGLRVTPDLDTVLYALAGVNDPVRGWGRAGDTERIGAELAGWSVGLPWFTLGDLDVATAIARTSWLRDGVPLHDVVARLAARWEPRVTLLPATDDEVETRVLLADGDDLHFQEWWVRHRAARRARAFVTRGAANAVPAPGVLDAIARADLVVVGPSNPVVSVGPILDIPGIADAVRATRAPVIGVSPIIGGRVVRGMADACLTAVGVATRAGAVGRHYGSRARGGLLDGWLVDEVDAAELPAAEGAGLRARAVPLWMTDPATTARLVDQVVALSAG